MHRTPGNIALAAGFTIDADHLHTCTQHSGNWYAAHERLLTVVQEILRAAGLRTKRHYVASSRGRRRGDLEVRDANVADKAHLILDIALVHEFHGACDTMSGDGAVLASATPPRGAFLPGGGQHLGSQSLSSHYGRTKQALGECRRPWTVSM